jgi:hypothetical protein
MSQYLSNMLQCQKEVCRCSSTTPSYLAHLHRLLIGRYVPAGDPRVLQPDTPTAARVLKIRPFWVIFNIYLTGSSKMLTPKKAKVVASSPSSRVGP